MEVQLANHRRAWFETGRHRFLHREVAAFVADGLRDMDASHEHSGRLAGVDDDHLEAVSDGHFLNAVDQPGRTRIGGVAPRGVAEVDRDSLLLAFAIALLLPPKR